MLKDKKIGGRVKLIIGGVATTQEFADKIDANGYKATAPRAPIVLRLTLLYIYYHTKTVIPAKAGI
mgnify:CR=1 FL=1